MKPDIQDRLLRNFEIARDMPRYSTEEEKRIFLQLQRYKLIEVNMNGKLIITKRGKAALEYGVQKYLSIERFEERLVKDSLRTRTNNKWLLITLIPLILILSGILAVALEVI